MPNSVVLFLDVPFALLQTLEFELEGEISTGSQASVALWLDGGCWCVDWHFSGCAFAFGFERAPIQSQDGFVYLFHKQANQQIVLVVTAVK